MYSSELGLAGAAAAGAAGLDVGTSAALNELNKLIFGLELEG